MGKMPTNSLGKSSELKLHCFCLFDAYSMPKDIYSAAEALPLDQGVNWTLIFDLTIHIEYLAFSNDIFKRLFAVLNISTALLL